MMPPLAFALYAFATCVALTSANVTPVGSLYAYGANISGLPLFYGDGMAYLGNGHPKYISTATNLTFKISDTSKTLISNPNNTALASNWTNPLLYINTQTGKFDPAGFVSGSNTTYTTAGFIFWGRILLFTGESEGGSVGRSFWAEPYGEEEEEEGFWRLLWNADNAASERAVPVVLKRQPPPEIGGKSDDSDE